MDVGLGGFFLHILNVRYDVYTTRYDNLSMGLNKFDFDVHKKEVG
jgi:hypothetical protein